MTWYNGLMRLRVGKKDKERFVACGFALHEINGLIRNLAIDDLSLLAGVKSGGVRKHGSIVIL